MYKLMINTLFNNYSHVAKRSGGPMREWRVEEIRVEPRREKEKI